MFFILKNIKKLFLVVFNTMYLNEIDSRIFNFLLQKINLEFPNLRKPKYDNKYYLEKIIFILRSGCSFRDSNFTSIKNHYSSIHKKFLLWSKKGLFIDLFNEVVKEFHNKFLRKAHKSTILNLFIDATNIRNKNGRETLGRNIKDKSKKGNKISTICTENKFTLGISIDEANRHDSKWIEKTLNNIPLINPKSEIKEKILELNKVNLIGDKGYIIKENRKKVLLKRGINMVHPYRKNQKKENTKEELKLLNKRHVIENTYASLKQNKYVQLRYSHTLLSYKSFVYLAVIIMNYRILFKSPK